MFKAPPTKAELEEMAAAGLTPEDFSDDEVEVWPENWPTFRLFHELQTQWRASATGLIGLDYNVLFHKLDRMKLAVDEYDDWEHDIRSMELAALSEMNTQRG